MRDGEAAGFQRARRPEQVQARRQAILDTAVAMLGEMPIAEISLNELSRRVGLAKSNVLRYFETREAIFLELLDMAWREWLAQLETALPAAVDDSAPAATRCEQAGETVAVTLAGQPVLGELVSVTSSVLERNVSTEVARCFKLAALEASAALAGMVRARLPELTETAALHFAGSVFVITAGLWPLAHPSASVTAAYEDPDLAGSRVQFADGLRGLLVTMLAGLLAQSTDPEPTEPASGQRACVFDDQTRT